MKIPRQTSMAAYNDIKERGLLSPMRWRVYNALFCGGPLTGAELNAVATENRRDFTPGFHKRLSELKDLGVVCEVGERECRVTGRTAIEWDVTDKLPKERAKQYARPTPAEISRALEVFEFWDRRAEMFGDRPSDDVVKVLAWLRRKAL